MNTKYTTLTIRVLFILLLLVSCKKDNSTDQQINKATAVVPPPEPITIVEFHKEGGHRFLGLFGEVKYRTVEKSITGISTLDGNTYIHVLYNCIGKGNIKCSTSISDNAASPIESNYFEIIDSIHVYEGNINSIVDMLVQEIDENTIERHIFTGSFTRVYSLPTIENSSVDLCFNVLWENGNSNGDANIQISVFHE